jgi:hypothetical protein
MKTLIFEFPKIYGLEYLEKKAYQEKVEKIIRIVAPKCGLEWKAAFINITCSQDEGNAIQATLFMFYRVKPWHDLIGAEK